MKPLGKQHLKVLMNKTQKVLTDFSTSRRLPQHPQPTRDRRNTALEDRLGAHGGSSRHSLNSSLSVPGARELEVRWGPNPSAMEASPGPASCNAVCVCVCVCIHIVMPNARTQKRMKELGAPLSAPSSLGELCQEPGQTGRTDAEAEAPVLCISST